MKPITILNTTALPLRAENVDTDQIIPARYLTAVTKAGMGDGLFAAWRYDSSGGPKQDFVLNQPQYPEFDAVFCGDDDAAIGVLNSLKEHEIAVPQKVSVVGFDDSRLSAFLNPALTTVRAPSEKVGHEAVRKLIRILNNKPVEDLTLLPTEIILRDSCGCHRKTV